jgi:phosphoketolase
VKRRLQDELIDHERYIRIHGENMLEMRDWLWSERRAAASGTK